MSAEELNSNQTSPQMGAEPVSELDVPCTAPSRGTREAAGRGSTRRCVWPQPGAPVGCSVCAKYIFSQTDKSDGKNTLLTLLVLRR